MKTTFITAFALFFFVLVNADERKKSKRVFKGYDGIEVYEREDDTSTYFILSARNKFAHNEFNIFRFDSLGLKKFAVNYNEITKPEFKENAYADLSNDILLTKQGARCLIAGNYGVSWLPVKQASALSHAILSYLGDTISSNLSHLSVVKNVRYVELNDDGLEIELIEYVTDTSTYFHLIFNNREYLNDVELFRLHSNEVKVLTDAFWELTKPSYGDGYAIPVTDTLAVQKRDGNYFIGKTKGTNAYTYLSKKQLVIFVNGIRELFGAEIITE